MKSTTHILALRGASLLAIALAGGCATGDQSTSLDSGGPPPAGDAGHVTDTGVVIVDSGFPSLDVGTPPPQDTGAGDTTKPSQDGTVGMEAAAETSTGMDSPVTSMDTGTPDTGHDSGNPSHDTGTGTCTAVAVPGPTGTVNACPNPKTGQCAPGGLPGGFAPITPNPVAMPGSCTTAQIQTIYNDCFGTSGSQTACDNDQTGATANCYSCINTDSDPTMTEWGPVLETSNGLAELNVGGCIQMLEPCNAACAATFWNDDQCEQAECATNCPVTDSTSDTAYNNCIDTVDSCDPKGCATYNAGTACEADLTGAKHPASVCVSGMTFEANFLAVVAAFCK